jgi:hypothetical protein
MIPPVRTWNVRFYNHGRVTHQAYVNTINKRFARWIANERLGYPGINSDRCVISLVKGKNLERISQTTARA